MSELDALCIVHDIAMNQAVMNGEIREVPMSVESSTQRALRIVGERIDKLRGAGDR